MHDLNVLVLDKLFVLSLKCICIIRNAYIKTFCNTFLCYFLSDEAVDVKLATAIDYSDITEVADEDEADVRKYRDAMATMKTSSEGVLTEMFS